MTPATCPSRPRRRTAAALLMTAAMGVSIPASAQSPDLTSPAFPTVASQGPALAPTESTRPDDRLADGTSFTSVPVVIKARRPPSSPVAPPDPQGAATVLADHFEVSGDRVLTASGGVVIWFKGARLIAERVAYDDTTGEMAIEGPIHLTEPGTAGTDNEVIVIADAAQLDRTLQDGVLTGVRMVLARELQFAATEVRRSDQGRKTTLSNVVASSCQVCASDPTPLWEIRARLITHDAETRRIRFDRPHFRAFGLPIATLPALSAPDPTVDRMTGFLAPRFRTTSGLGFGIKLPYFITLGDSADVTLTPYVSASRTTTLGLRYRQAFVNGATEINGAVSRDDLAEGTRGYLFGGAAFLLPHDYLLGLQLQTASDRAYLLDYDITDADRLWSGVTLSHVDRDKLVAARVGRYETLRENEDEATAPDLVADGLWERRFQPGWLGGEAGVQFSVHAHRRRSDEDIVGRDIARGSARLDWQRSEILPLGIVAAAQARLDADLYSIGDDSRFDSTEARAIPVGAVEFRWPLIAHSGNAAHVLEPTMQIVWSPELDDEDRVPNDDSRLIEFDEGNLFALDRLPGRDAVESGLRANLGVTWARIDPTGWSLGVTVGRVLRDEPDPVFKRGGEFLQGRSSDWLLSTTYSNSNGLALVNRALFDSDMTVHRDELRLGWLGQGFELSAGYLWVDASTEDGRPRDVSELTATTGFDMAPGWRATAETRYDFAMNQAQKAELGLEYRNECVTLDLSVSRRFTSSDTFQADTDVGLSVRLGGFGRQRGDGAATVARRTCLR